ncbi:hypothetical protein [Kitasatospora sp. NPDC050543]|uniref:SCO2583/SCO2584 N-terminal domain-containing protein n=1 Tax=Kitasatospora sp. NPDC050543 TaxID=3364054 RepID=UPI0037B1BBA2
MSNSDRTLPGQNGPDDGGQWNVVFDEDFVRRATVTEPSAGARLRLVGGPGGWSGGPGGSGGPGVGRLWLRRLALGVPLALCAVVLAFGVFGILNAPSGAGASAPVTVTAPTSTASPAPPALPASPGSAADMATAPATGQATAARSGSDPAVPLDVAFPAEVVDASGARFTRLGAAVAASCTPSDSVGPGLAELIARSHGCADLRFALYKDAQNNQFNLAVFTMKDPKDVVHLVTRLSMAFDDYEVGVQAPPPGSGLPTLPADSGLVQAFAGGGRAMVVGLGQWSDGRVADYQKLGDRLQPLLQSVSKNVFAYETGH